MNTKTKKRNKIKKRIRKVVFGTPERPRMTVFRSNKAIYAPVSYTHLTLPTKA